MINADEIAVVCVAHGCEWTGDAMRRAYEAIIRTWTEAGIEPERLGAGAPGVGKKYGTFKSKRRYLEKVGFDKVESFEMVRLAEGRKNEMTEWVASAHHSLRTQSFDLGWVPAILGSKAAGFLNLFKVLASIGNAKYGYLLQQRMKLGPQLYAIGLGLYQPKDSRPRDSAMNVSAWSNDRERVIDAGILRDVYPQNFLNAEYLTAPNGKTAMTLREWIEDEPTERGILKPFTDTLEEWMPPVQNIPMIREALYRAGRVFSYRFFCSQYYEPDGAGWVDEVNYRPDPRAPWEAPEPIPEIFRAEFYKDKDPGLVY